ncbi:unnamed protein product, partial [Hapterophycus canaliculatus]
PVQDPEDDRDRASSCSSADAPVHSGGRAAGGGIVRPGSRGKVARGGGKGKGSRSDDGGRGAVSIPAEDASAHSPPRRRTTTTTAASEVLVPSPNSPGGVVPWHHTSVYEANNPTEDRHAELSHDALGVKIYCVCDGHGGSRAAQFVCDRLAADVLARVESIAATAGAGARESDGGVGGGRGGASSGEGEGGSDDSKSGRGGGWRENEAEIRRSLTDAFTSCDEQFIAQLDPTKNKGYINAGCCVVLALLLRSKLYVAHVGDCRVVLGTTDAARFSPDLLAITGAPSTPTDSGAAAAAMGKRFGGGQSAGAVGSSGKGRGSRGVGEAATAGARRVASPPRPATVTADGDLRAVALSRDHNCEDADEVALVRARSGDDNAIRVSRNDEWKGARAIKRVAGSLAVTRAVGDAYLKKAVFSFSPYKEGVPYITAEPVVTTVELTSKDRFLVLATDGVWEQISNEEAVHCVSRALRSASGGGPTSRRQRSATHRNASSGGATGGAGAVTSDALVDFVLARSAQSHGMSVSALRALPRGSSRRMLHDDVCATVVHFTSSRSQRAHL